MLSRRAFALSLTALASAAVSRRARADEIVDGEEAHPIDAPASEFAAGVDDPVDVDCIVAMVAGLIDAQASNDPEGTRWTRHLDRLVDLHLDNPAKGAR